MNPVRAMMDGLTSFASGLGTGRDKASSLVRTVDLFTDIDAYNLYETSALARNIVDLPALDSCREWRDWKTDKENIQKLEDEENRLNLRGKVLQARKWARLFGGSALFIGIGGNAAAPLDASKVGIGGLKYVTVLDRTNLTAGEIETDPASEYYGLPKVYRLANQNGATTDIHPSRLAIFTGFERPYSTLTSLTGFGTSVLASAVSTINQADGTAANIASLVFEAKIDVISIPDLMNRISDPRYEASLLTRFGVAARAKGINGTLILDASEVYDQKTANFSTLPDILNSFLQLVAGAARMPATMLLGQAPQGMNATGEGDYKNYLDRIQSEQTLYMTPAMAKLDACLKQSAGVPQDAYYEWAPLWQSSEKEKADTFKVIVDAARVLVGGVDPIITVEAVSQSLTNLLVENGSLPGLDEAVDEFGSIDEQEPSEEEQLALEAQRKNVAMIGKPDPNKAPANRFAANDAAPRSLYVKRDVINSAAIVRWAKSQGFTDIDDDLHVTITYSTAAVDWFAMGTSWEDEIKFSAGGPRQIDRFDGGAVVLLIASNNLKWRHQEMVDLGASWDHEEYNPHITIAHDPEMKLDISKMTPYQGPITLGPEIFEEVKVQ